MWTIVSLAIQPNPPLDAVELVAWGHEWRLGYPKHPPLPAWLAEVARSAAGDAGTWALYLLGQLCVMAAFWAVWRLGRDVTAPRVALASVLLLEATGRYTWMTLEFNNNLVNLPFFPLTALFVYRALTSGRLGWWAAAGACLGLGLMTKYTIALLAVALVAFLLVNREARRRARGVGPYLAAAVAIVLVLPHVIWMARNGFPTIAYAIERSGSDTGLVGHIVHPAEFLTSQLLMIEFAWIALLVMLRWPWRWRPLDADARFDRHFLFVVGLAPGLLSLAASVVIGIRLRDPWGAPIWSLLPLFLLFSFELRAGPRVFRRLVFACGVFAVLNVGLAVAEGVVGPYVTREGSRTQFPGRLLAAQVSDAWRQRFGIPLELVGGERWVAGNVAFWAPSRPSVFTNVSLRTTYLDEAACPWTSVADFRRRGGVLVWPIGREEKPLPYEFRRHYPDAEVLEPLTLRYQTGAHVAPVQIGVAIVAPSARSR